MNKLLIPLVLSLTVLLSSCIIAKPKVLGSMSGYPPLKPFAYPNRCSA